MQFKGLQVFMGIFLEILRSKHLQCVCKHISYFNTIYTVSCNFGGLRFGIAQCVFHFLIQINFARMFENGRMICWSRIIFLGWRWYSCCPNECPCQWPWLLSNDIGVEPLVDVVVPLLVVNDDGEKYACKKVWKSVRIYRLI